MRFYESSPTLDKEHEQFEKDIAEFKSGELNPIKFKAFRVAHGVYEQRQPDTYMIRIRCAAGGITPTQLKKREIAEQYGQVKFILQHVRKFKFAMFELMMLCQQYVVCLR